MPPSPILERTSYLPIFCSISELMEPVPESCRRSSPHSSRSAHTANFFHYAKSTLRCTADPPEIAEFLGHFLDKTGSQVCGIGESIGRKLSSLCIKIKGIPLFVVALVLTKQPSCSHPNPFVFNKQSQAAYCEIRRYPDITVVIS